MENKKMSSISLYFHAGSENHGCEAIVRSTVALLETIPVLFSDNSDADKKYGLDSFTVIRPLKPDHLSIWDRMKLKIHRSEKFAYDLLSVNEVKKFDKSTIALSVGGDNYCYGDAYNWHLAGLNKNLHKKGGKTILWGCSINPEDVSVDMERDLSLYDLVVARESISYDFLRNVNANTILACDPAFTLKTDELPFPQNFFENHTVGINVSPLIQKCEKNNGAVLNSYFGLIQYILKETDYQIALIPHVVQFGNDDRTLLQILYEKIDNKRRVCMIKDCNCQQLKGYISRCSLFVGARTHATIAAYSSGVPTLVIGYSTKARGIAKDLFGTEENYVLPVQTLESSSQLIHAFQWLEAQKDLIKEQLLIKMPTYKSSIVEAVKIVRSL